MLIREGDKGVKESFEQLLKGESVTCPIDEQIVYNRLDDNEEAIWSLLLARDLEAMNGIYGACCTADLQLF